LSFKVESHKGKFKRLWFYISPRRRIQLGLLLVLMVIASLGEVVSIGAVLPFLGTIVDPQQVFDSEMSAPLIGMLGISQPSELILPLTIVFIIAAVVSGILRIALLWAQTRLGHAIGADLSFEIYRSTLYQTYATHVSRSSSEVIAGITEKSNGVVSSIITPLLMLASSVFLIFTIMATLLSINPIIALSAFFCFGLIYAVIIYATKRRLLLNGQRISNLVTKRIKALQEGLGGIRDVLLDGAQSTYTQVYRGADLPLRHAQASNQVIAGSPRYGIEAMGMVLIAVLAYILVSNSGDISNTIPVLGALAIGAQRMLPMLQQGFSSWSSIKGAEAVLNDALELLEQPLPFYANQKQPLPMLFEQAIVIKDLSFRYAPEAPWVLRHLNLQINKGARVGFIGATGSGKSTLLDILMGLLEVTDGQLVIDNTPIDDENHRAWRANIAHVPQTIFLADATIAENIAFGISTEEINHDWVRKAAQMAQIAETIERLEGQYEMIVGERGVRLSGGQRQRIGIARALYKQANVIIFDEATSALDNKTERAVMDAIDNIGRETTILMIAHRLTSLSGCDRVIELEHGQVKWQGSYEIMVEQRDC